MRYEEIENIVFTDLNGRTAEIKDMREYKEQQLDFSLSIKNKELPDEIASREEVYGQNAESESYKIVDFNRVIFFDSDFDMDKISKIEIPIQ